MRLAGANRARQNEILGGGDPLAARQRVDLSRADAVRRGEVERVERLHLRKARLPQPLANDGLMARRLLGGEDFVEIILMRPMRIARLTSECLKSARDPG